MLETQVAEIIERIEALSKPLQWVWRIVYAAIVVTSAAAFGYASMDGRIRAIETGGSTALRSFAEREQTSRDRLQATLDRIDKTLSIVVQQQAEQDRRIERLEASR